MCKCHATGEFVNLKILLIISVIVKEKNLKLKQFFYYYYYLRRISKYILKLNHKFFVICWTPNLLVLFASKNTFFKSSINLVLEFERICDMPEIFSHEKY